MSTNECQQGSARSAGAAGFQEPDGPERPRNALHARSSSVDRFRPGSKPLPIGRLPTAMGVQLATDSVSTCREHKGSGEGRSPRGKHHKGSTSEGAWSVLH